jgi:hypothetical protein
MFVMKVAKDRQDWHRVEQYERDVKTQLTAAELADLYNKQVHRPASHAHALWHALHRRIFSRYPLSFLFYRFDFASDPRPSQDREIS